eukprot:scaffold16428_cov108-Isochrysis_galbana.AAC.4
MGRVRTTWRDTGAELARRALNSVKDAMPEEQLLLLVVHSSAGEPSGTSFAGLSTSAESAGQVLQVFLSPCRTSRLA